jgi:undecaprenyl-diphosphatase
VSFVSHLTYAEASVVGLIQGVTELFPLSSIGHNVLLPALVGGSWATDLNVGASESPYLAFIVGMHVATAIALLIYFWREWVRIVRGFFSSLGQFLRPAPGTRWWQLQSADQRLAWLIILATIPVGLVGLKFEHLFRVITGHAITAAYFLIANGLILYAGERFRRPASQAADREQAAAAQAALARESAAVREPAPAPGREPATAPELATAGAAPPEPVTAPRPVTARPPSRPGRPAAGRHASGQRALRRAEEEQAVASDRRLAGAGVAKTLLIGSTQVLALLAGISRDGVCMVTGMFAGLSRQDAARFSFLLATPVIFAAGALKLGDLMGPLGDGIRGQVLAGSVLSGVGAYVSVRFLVRYLRTRTLYPFAAYCVVVGVGSAIYLNLR